MSAWDNPNAKIYRTEDMTLEQFALVVEDLQEQGDVEQVRRIRDFCINKFGKEPEVQAECR